MSKKNGGRVMICPKCNKKIKIPKESWHEITCGCKKTKKEKVHKYIEKHGIHAHLPFGNKGE
jgi:hypothetical protein